jgi:hypothetical protein
MAGGQAGRGLHFHRFHTRWPGDYPVNDEGSPHSSWHGHCRRSVFHWRHASHRGARWHPYGATTIAGPRGELQPTKEDLAIASALGQRVATIAKKLRTEVYNVKMTPHVGAQPSRRYSPKMACSTIPKRASTVAATRLCVGGAQTSMPTSVPRQQGEP